MVQQMQLLQANLEPILDKFILMIENVSILVDVAKSQVMKTQGRKVLFSCLPWVEKDAPLLAYLLLRKTSY